ncbi:Transducin/WD40 repeat-like superfamily protein [Zea mays]|uniref:Transducin/WD40 repeat-like superfamily protein n=1 Tax=Zea mays TaxID=4577 RepID=A0A1D6ICH6_MAIZE|nr:Transducin/WD40 repeat-like superfamily protein [Zea mays]
MPRTTVLESPGCPPLRALTTDILGLVKVVEAHARPAGAAKVVETWGAPDASCAIVAASLADRATDPVLAVARMNGVVELLNPLNGDTLAAVKAVGPAPNDGGAEGDPLTALHLFTRQASDSILGTFLACTEQGKASIRSITKENAASGSHIEPSATWDVCGGANVQFCSVDHGENYVMFGGKDQHSRPQAPIKEGCDRLGKATLNLAVLMEAKQNPLEHNPPSNVPYRNQGMVLNGKGQCVCPLKLAAMLAKRLFWEDSDAMVKTIPISEKLFIGGGLNGHVGTTSVGFEAVHEGFDMEERINEHAWILRSVDNIEKYKVAMKVAKRVVRLYDTALQRRPAISVEFKESPIKAVAADPNGHDVYIGTGTGDLASFDMRTGKLLGCYFGKCSGSIRSIVRHPDLPLIASCGLDSYLRIWDTNTRQLLSAVFLKQHLTTVVLDSHFSVEEPGEMKSKQLESSVETETEVRKEKKKKSKAITEDETEAQIRKEKKSRTIEEEEQAGLVDHSDINDEVYARKEKKKKKSRGIEGGKERDSDGEICSPKRRKSGERSKCLKKRSKKQLVA